MGETVIEALRAMRPPFALYEADLHAMVGDCLTEHGLPLTHEARLGGGCRIDYLVGSVGVEIKKGKPSAALLRRQLTRYAQCESVTALVVVTWRRVALPENIGGKPILTLVLGQLWGVSLP
jgi:hypothetical protein